MLSLADIAASIVPTLRRTFWSINGNSDVGRNKTARRQSGRAFPAVGAPETPVLRLTRGQAYSGLRREMYNDEPRSLGTNKITTGAILC
jgi:hypothetical protein